MKFKAFMLFCLALFAFVSASAQVTTSKSSWGIYDEILTISYSEIDSIDTDTSASFTLAKFNNVSFSDMPIKVQYQAVSTLGTPKLTVYIDGSFDGTNWVRVDTLVTDLTSEAVTQADLDLNNQKYPYYRQTASGVASNHSDTTFYTKWYLYQRE